MDMGKNHCDIYSDCLLG